MLALEMSFQIGGVPVEKFLAALLAFAAGDFLIFPCIEDLNLLEFLVDMTEVELWSLVLWCRPRALSLTLHYVGWSWSRDPRIRAKSSMKYKVK